jgi:undecaprenyl pyrophosphate synthase
VCRDSAAFPGFQRHNSKAAFKHVTLPTLSTLNKRIQNTSLKALFQPLLKKMLKSGAKQTYKNACTISSIIDSMHPLL